MIGARDAIRFPDLPFTIPTITAISAGVTNEREQDDMLFTRLYHLLRNYALPICAGAFVGGCGPDIDHIVPGPARSWGHDPAILVVSMCILFGVVLAYYSGLFKFRILRRMIR